MSGPMNIKKRRNRPKWRDSEPAQFIADLEFASRQIPNTLVLSGWLIHDSPRPICWGLLARETYQEIAKNVVTFSRPDLRGSDETKNYTRLGFIAFIEGNLECDDVQLTIGTLENLTQICLPISVCHNNDLRLFFPQSHQLFRFATAQRISALRKEEAEVVSDILNSVLHSWMREVTFLDGSIHQRVEAGLDHCLCTPTGECYVEGWINPLDNRNFKLSACLLGADSSKTLLQRSTFRRPDIAGNTEFSGFAFVGRAEFAADQDPMLLLQAHFPDSDDVSYAKINLTRVGIHDFNRTLWSRILDIQSINPEALHKILAFTREAQGLLDAPAANRKQGRGDDKLDALIIQNDENDVLHNLLILTLPLAQFNFSKIMLLSTDPLVSELWWPNVGQMLILNPYRTLGEALSGIDNGLLLIMDVSSMANANFVSDVRVAAKLIEKYPDMKCVLFTNKTFLSSQPSRDHLSIEVKVPNKDHCVWFQLCKGAAIPPILVRTAVLRNFVKHAWAHPAPVLTLRRFLKSVSSQALWFETLNAEVFYARPHVPTLPADRADLLYQLDARI
jgi:hypothetical protein